MCIRRSLCRVLSHPDDGEDNPRRGRRGFSAFVSLARTPDPDADPRWEARTIPMDPPPVAIRLPFEDPDHEDERAEAEIIDIRADLRAMQYQLHRDQCNAIG